MEQKSHPSPGVQTPTVQPVDNRYSDYFQKNLVYSYFRRAISFSKEILSSNFLRNGTRRLLRCVQSRSCQTSQGFEKIASSCTRPDIRIDSVIKQNEVGESYLRVQHTHTLCFLYVLRIVHIDFPCLSFATSPHSLLCSFFFFVKIRGKQNK